MIQTFQQHHKTLAVDIAERTAPDIGRHLCPGASLLEVVCSVDGDVPPEIHCELGFEAYESDIQEPADQVNGEPV